jgi:hypothetical protein
MYAVFLACSGMLWAGTPPPERARLPVTHPIARGETHSYELMVPAQTYVRLVLDLVDIDTWVQGEGTAWEAVFESSREGGRSGGGRVYDPLLPQLVSSRIRPDSSAAGSDTVDGSQSSAEGGGIGRATFWRAARSKGAFSWSVRRHD